MTEQGIEEIFKSAFNNFEADVDPNVWTNVQQAIHVPTAAPASHGANGSIAGKAAAVAGKLGVKAIIAIVTAATGVSVGAYFLVKDKPSEKIVPVTVQIQQPAPQAIIQQPPPATNEQAQTTRETNVAPKFNTVAAEPKVTEEKKQIVTPPFNNSQAQQSPSASTVTPAKPAPPANTPTLKEAAPAKPSPTTNAPPVTASGIENTVTHAEEPPAAENHTFQNGLTNLDDYIDDEASATKGLPNAFSPNGDGRNDVFQIHTKNLKSMVVTIFDRSGKQIYRWDRLDGQWDGKLADGNPAPTGVYFYSVMAETVDGKPCIGSSNLTLTH